MAPTGSPDYRDGGLAFPPPFVIGSATASFQIEGAVREDGRFRTNLVLANASPTSLVVNVGLLDPNGLELARKSYTLQPLGMTQVTQVVRDLGVTPHVSQNTRRSGGSAIDRRTTRHAGYAQSQACRPRIERVFGWIKSVAGLRKVKLRGLAKVDGLMVFASAAFNLRRLSRLLAVAPA